MTSGPDQNENETASVIEELTAYLDGELDQESIERVESRLGSDPEYRNEMQGLQRTWDLLDQLPATDLGSSFTQTTMKLVVGEEVKIRQSGKSWVWPVRIAILLAVPALLFAGSYGLTRNWHTAADRILIDHLTVVGHHPYYTTAKLDNEFVDGLLLFFGDTMDFRGTDIPTSLDQDVSVGTMKMLLSGGSDRENVRSIANDQAGRRGYVESLPAGDKRQLQVLLKDYLAMTPDKKAALLDFDNELKEREDLPERLLAMRRFYDWVQADTDERIELYDLQAGPAMRKIEELLDKTGQVELIASGLPDLSPEDTEIFFKWYETACYKSEEEIRTRFYQAVKDRYEKSGRRRPSRLSSIAGEGYLAVLVDGLLRLDRPFVEETIMNTENLQWLESSMSKAAKQMLSSKQPWQQQRLILSWVEAANQAKLDINPTELRRFRKTLSDSQREALRKMPTHLANKALKQLYRDQSKMGDDFSEEELRAMLESESIDFE